MVRHRSIGWDSEPLGEMADARLASILKVHRSAVKYQRDKRGIPAFSHWDKQPLGGMSDVMLAKINGCTKSAVRKARVVRGIPKYTAPCVLCEKLIRPSGPAAVCSECQPHYAREINRIIGRQRSRKTLSKTEKQIIAQHAKMSRLIKTVAELSQEREKNDE